MTLNLSRKSLAVGRGDDVGCYIHIVDYLLSNSPCKRLYAKSFRIAFGEYVAGIAIDINDIHIEVVAEGLHHSHLAIVAEHATTPCKMSDNHRRQLFASGNLQPTAHQTLPDCRTCRFVHAVAKRCHATRYARGLGYNGRGNGIESEFEVAPPFADALQYVALRTSLAVAVRHQVLETIIVAARVVLLEIQVITPAVPVARQRLASAVATQDGGLYVIVADKKCKYIVHFRMSFFLQF